MQILEEGRGHLDWIGSGGTWNLQNYQYDTQCFSDMFECKGKSINNIYIYSINAAGLVHCTPGRKMSPAVTIIPCTTPTVTYKSQRPK